MRDINRIDIILNKLRELWLLNPDLRFIQMLRWIDSSVSFDTFYLEDDEFLELIEDKINIKPQNINL